MALGACTGVMRASTCRQEIARARGVDMAACEDAMRGERAGWLRRSLLEEREIEADCRERMENIK